MFSFSSTKNPDSGRRKDAQDWPLTTRGVLWSDSQHSGQRGVHSQRFVSLLSANEAFISFHRMASDALIIFSPELLTTVTGKRPSGGC